MGVSLPSSHFGSCPCGDRSAKEGFHEPTESLDVLFCVERNKIPMSIRELRMQMATECLWVRGAKLVRLIP